MDQNKVERLKTTAPAVKARPLRNFWRRWSPLHLRRRIEKLEREKAEHDCADNYRRPFPVYVAGDPRFEGAESIFCRVEIGTRHMMTRQGPAPTTCFVMSEDQTGTEMEVIGDAYGPKANQDDSGRSDGVTGDD